MADVKKIVGALTALARRPDGKIDLGAVMRDVEYRALNGLERPDMIRMNRAVDAKDWAEAEVPIRSLYATQPYANQDYADAAARRIGDGADLPLVVRAPDRRMYVRDGHHRLTSLADQGSQTAKVRLVDLVPPDDEPMLPFGKARGGLAHLAKGGQPSDEDRALLESLSPGGARYVAGDKADGEGFDRARRNYATYKATGSISERPETVRGALATLLAGDQRMSPAKARFVEGLTGSTPAGGGLGVGMIDFVPGLGAAVTASDVANSDSPGLDATIGAGLQALPFAGPLMRAGKTAVTSRAGKAAIGAAAAGAMMTPDDAEASLVGFMQALRPPFSKLDRAEAMVKKGRPAHEIWRHTGLERGRDGEWRFEVPDNGMTVRTDRLLANPRSNMRLGEVVDHPELFAQYPGLRDILYHYDSGINAKGMYMPRSSEGPERIVKGPIRDLDDPANLSTILHEMQHAIQAREGFAHGTNPGWAFKEALDDIARQASPGGIDKARALDDPEWEVSRRLGMQQALESLTPEAKWTVQNGLYHRNAGEVEARNVQDRLRYNQAARETTRPELSASVPRIQQIHPGGDPEGNLAAYERLLTDIATHGHPYAEGGPVESKSALDELLELAGGQS